MFEKLVKFTTFCYLITNSINYSFKVTFNKKVCPFFSPLQILIMYSRRNKLKNIKNKCNSDKMTSCNNKVNFNTKREKNVRIFSKSLLNSPHFVN